MKTLSELDMFVPCLESDTQKQILGGFTNLRMPDGSILIQGSVCVADKPDWMGGSYCTAFQEEENLTMGWKEWADSINWGVDQWGGGHCDTPADRRGENDCEWNTLLDVAYGFASGNFDVDYDCKEHVVFDYDFPPDAQQIILSVIATLPEDIQNMNVKVIINHNLIKQLSGNKDGINNACFLPEGYKMKDGTTLDQDTIVLDNLTVASALQEEKVHQWQYHNCRTSDDVELPTIVGCMEFQNDILEYILETLRTEGQTNEPVNQRGLSDLVLPYCDIDNHTFDYAGFLSRTTQENWDDLYKTWNKGCTKNEKIDLSDGNNYSHYYNWNWGGLFQQFFGPTLYSQPLERY